MAGSKTYLNVLFAQKDAAKALGARWDSANKKRYVPGDRNILRPLSPDFEFNDKTDRSRQLQNKKIALFYAKKTGFKNPHLKKQAPGKVFLS